MRQLELEIQPDRRLSLVEIITKNVREKIKTIHGQVIKIRLISGEKKNTKRAF